MRSNDSGRHERIQSALRCTSTGEEERIGIAEVPGRKDEYGSQDSKAQDVDVWMMT